MSDDATTGIGALIIAWITREAVPAIVRRKSNAAEVAQWNTLIDAHRRLAEDLAQSRDECRRDHAAALQRIALLEREREEDRAQIERLTDQVREALETLAERRTVTA